jgi:hypothetical protein
MSTTVGLGLPPPHPLHVGRLTLGWMPHGIHGGATDRHCDLSCSGLKQSNPYQSALLPFHPCDIRFFVNCTTKIQFCAPGCQEAVPFWRKINIPQGGVFPSKCTENQHLEQSDPTLTFRNRLTLTFWVIVMKIQKKRVVAATL